MAVVPTVGCRLQRDHAPLGVMHDSYVANVAGTHNASSRQVHREFVLYDHRAAYPEFIVHFNEPKPQPLSIVATVDLASDDRRVTRLYFR